MRLRFFPAVATTVCLPSPEIKRQNALSGSTVGAAYLQKPNNKVQSLVEARYSESFRNKNFAIYKDVAPTALAEFTRAAPQPNLHPVL
jgi:hypothetical protein